MYINMQGILQAKWIKKNCNQTKVDNLLNYNINKLSLNYSNFKYIMKHVEHGELVYFF